MDPLIQPWWHTRPVVTLPAPTGPTVADWALHLARAMGLPATPVLVEAALKACMIPAQAPADEWTDTLCRGLSWLNDPAWCAAQEGQS